MGFKWENVGTKHEKMFKKQGDPSRPSYIQSRVLVGTKKGKVHTKQGVNGYKADEAGYKAGPRQV